MNNIEKEQQQTDIENEQKSQQSSLTKEEKFNIVMLVLLYSVQGLTIGFFVSAVQMLLAEKGASNMDLSIFSFVLYPFSFKLIFAPIEDTFYSNKFGKRKTYIVPLQYILGVLMYCSSFKIQDWIDNKDISQLTFVGNCILYKVYYIMLHTILIGFIAILICATQDIGVDGIVLTMLSEQNVGLGSACQSAGQIVGFILSSSIFLQLNSEKFYKQFIDNVDGHKLLSTEKYMMVMSIYIILLTVYFHLLVKEKKVEEDEPKIKDIVYSMKGFYKNPNLLVYIVHMLIWRVGFSPVESSLTTQLIRKGFEKEMLTTIPTLLTPVSIILPIIFAKKYKPGNELDIVKQSFILKLVDYVTQYLLLQFDSPNVSFYICFFISNLYSTIIMNVMFINQGSFINRIADPTDGGTFLTCLASCNNLGGTWPNQLSLFAMQYIEFDWLVGFGLVYSSGYYFMYLKRIGYLQSLSREEFKLQYKQQ